jgi:ABC-type transport system substrate-binding protein
MKKRAWLVVAAVVALVCTGCAKSTTEGGTGTSTSTTSTLPQKPVEGGTLSIGLDAETDGWNPTASEWAGAAYYVAQTIFDPLAEYDASGQAHPYLAKSITHSSDYKVWTIGLRPNIKFSDGEPLNAAAVVLQLTKAKASSLVGQALGPMVSAVAEGDLTVKVNMSEPWVAFPAVLASQVGFMAAPKQLNASTSEAASSPIGSGPFIFKQWIRDSTLTVVRNPNYWRPGLPHVSEIVFRVITDPQTRLQSLQSGQIQYMYTTTASTIKEYQTNSSEVMVEQHVDEPAFVMLNTDAAPLNSLQIRLALEYATDQNQLNQAISLGLGSVATEPYAPGSPWYVPSGYPTKPDPAKAASLVKAYEAAHHISGPVKFTLGCVPSGTNPEAMQLVEAQWAKIGIDVTLSYTEQATYISNAIFGSYQANCWTQFGSPDPDLDATWWLSANAHPVGQVALNFARLSDSTTDAQLQIGRTDPNVAARKAAYGQVWHQFAIEAPYIWLGRAPDALLFSPTVHGVGLATFPDGAKEEALAHAGVDVPIDQLWLS